MESSDQRPPVAPPRRQDQPQQDGPSTSHSATTTTLEDFPSLVKGAYDATAEAQNLDLRGSLDAAFKEYEKALQLIDKAVSLESTLTETQHEQLYRMRITRKEILERLSDLQHRSASWNLPPVDERSADLPPAYVDALMDDFIAEELQAANLSANPLPQNARELFAIPTEVQIYFISPDDNVSAPSYPSFLRLVSMEPCPDAAVPMPSSSAAATAPGNASVPAFLQVGDWCYPLIRGQSPLFRSLEGIYIFPDLSMPQPGSYVGLILPESITPETRQAFEENLLSLVGMEAFPPIIQPVQPQEKPPRPAPPGQRVTEATPVTPQEISVYGEEIQEPAPPLPQKRAVVKPTPAVVEPIPTERRLSTKIAEGLMSGAEAVSQGLITGAGKASVLMDKGAAYIQSRMDPVGDKPAVIRPEVRQGMKTAKSVSGKAVKVSGFIVHQVGNAMTAMGRYMAPHVHNASTKIWAKTVGGDEVDASRRVDQVLEVTSGAVVGFGTVYFGLEHAARTLASNLADNTVQIVHHKYGEEAREFAKDTATTAGNTVATAWNAKALGPTSVAKRAVKDTGKMVLENHQLKKGGPPAL